MSRPMSCLSDFCEISHLQLYRGGYMSARITAPLLAVRSLSRKKKETPNQMALAMIPRQ